MAAARPELTFGYVDLAGYRHRHHPPEELLERAAGGIWLYAATPLGVAKSEWRRVSEGQKVRVPLLPYCSMGKDPENAVGHAVCIGFMAAYEVHTLLSSSERVKRVHLSIGVPVEELEGYLELADGGREDCYRYWVGVAVQVGSG